LKQLVWWALLAVIIIVVTETVCSSLLLATHVSPYFMSRCSLTWCIAGQHIFSL